MVGITRSKVIVFVFTFYFGKLQTTKNNIHHFVGATCFTSSNHPYQKLVGIQCTWTFFQFKSVYRCWMFTPYYMRIFDSTANWIWGPSCENMCCFSFVVVGQARSDIHLQMMQGARQLCLEYTWKRAFVFFRLGVLALQQDFVKY